METETLYNIAVHTSKQAKLGSLILSVKTIDFDEQPRSVGLVVGRIGLPSLSRTLTVGDAVLFEAPDEGLFEVRVISILQSHEGYDLSADCATFSISRLLPQRAPTAGVANEGTSNLPFTPPEIARIRQSIKAVKDSVRQREDLNSEQIDYISRKLDEIVDAANRFGRKDWINLTVGTLTNVVVGAALGSDAAKFLFQRMGQALAWLLGETLKLLP